MLLVAAGVERTTNASVWEAASLEALALIAFWGATVQARITPSIRWLGFAVGMLAVTNFARWSATANHSWMALWLLAPAPWIRLGPDHYATYVRRTLALVIAWAGIQKLIAGTYVDGSFLAYMTAEGSPTERALSLVCSSSECVWFPVLGTLAIVGELLIAGALWFSVRTPWVVGGTVAFLLAVGVYSDELNFFVMNVAALFIAWRWAMNDALKALLLGILVLDHYTLAALLGGG